MSSRVESVEASTSATNQHGARAAFADHPGVEAPPPEAYWLVSIPSGGAVAEERVFDGMRIPTRMTVGWFYGTERAAKGEFFRLNITRAQFL